MDIALCTEDGTTYTAVDFSRLPPIELARKRRLLECPECSGPAYFRKASRSGRAACFGARPHQEGCELAAPEYERMDDGAGQDQDTLENPGTRIVVDFNFGTPDQPEHVETEGLPPNRERRGRFTGDGERDDARMHRRLSTLLRNLIEAPAFRFSNQLLEIEGYPETTVRDFFVPLSDVNVDFNGQFKGYWGMLSDARFAHDRTLWLNSGGRDNISFCVQTAHANTLYQRYRIEDEEDLAGAYILVFGTVQISQNDKLYCVVNDIGYMSLRLA